MIMFVVIWFNHNVLDTPYLGYIREVHAMIMVVVVIWFNHNVLDTPYLGYTGCQCYDYVCCYMVQSQCPRHTLSGIYTGSPCYDYGCCCYMVQSQCPRHTLSGIYGMSML